MLARLTDAYTISIVAVVDFALECPLLRVEMDCIISITARAFSLS